MSLTDDDQAEPHGTEKALGFASKVRLGKLAERVRALRGSVEAMRNDMARSVNDVQRLEDELLRLAEAIEKERG